MWFSGRVNKHRVPPVFLTRHDFSLRCYPRCDCISENHARIVPRENSHSRRRRYYKFSVITNLRHRVYANGLMCDGIITRDIKFSALGSEYVSFDVVNGMLLQQRSANYVHVRRLRKQIALYHAVNSFTLLFLKFTIWSVYNNRINLSQMIVYEMIF